VRRMVTDACLFVSFCWLFYRGDGIDPVALEQRERAHLTRN